MKTKLSIAMICAVAVLIPGIVLADSMTSIKIVNKTSALFRISNFTAGPCIKSKNLPSISVDPYKTVDISEVFSSPGTGSCPTNIPGSIRTATSGGYLFQFELSSTPNSFVFDATYDHTIPEPKAITLISSSTQPSNPYVVNINAGTITITKKGSR